MPSGPGASSSWSSNGRSGSAAAYGLIGSGPTRTSSMAAVSRTVRETTPWVASPLSGSLSCGPNGTSPRPGLSPTRPVHAAGMRIDPPPSLAPATGTMPAATAAAAPPEDPPGVRLRFHGLRVGPNSADSVTPLDPNSGVLVLPKTTTPASSQRCTIVLVCAAFRPTSARHPSEIGRPASLWYRPLGREGAPADGPHSRPA